MNISIVVKKIGSKRVLMKDLSISIDDNSLPITLEDFIKAVVKQGVDEFNDKVEGKSILPYLTKEQIKEKAHTGKISEGLLFNDERQDVQKAYETAILAHQDGLYKVFIDDNLIDELKEEIPIQQGAEVSFVRLTFLTGGIFYG